MTRATPTLCHLRRPAQVRGVIPGRDACHRTLDKVDNVTATASFYRTGVRHSPAQVFEIAALGRRGFQVVAPRHLRKGIG